MSYIKLDRKLLSWEWKDDPNMVALWIEILLQANYTETKWHGETYEPGTFPTSYEKLARATGLTKSQVRTCLSKLELTREIALIPHTKSHNRETKICVVKWAEFQGRDDDVRTPNRTQNAQNFAPKSQHLKKEKNTRIQEDILPIYDDSENKTMSEEEERELMSLMKGEA